MGPDPKSPKPEEIVVQLRQVEVLMGQGIPRVDAIRQISVTEQTYYRWKKKRAVVRHWSEDNCECGMHCPAGLCAA